MKLYTIKEGTESTVLTLTKVNQVTKTGFTARWATLPCYRTSKDLAFTETVLDPISVIARAHTTHPRLAEMAEAGYAVFRDEDSTEDREYFLAVPYNSIEVF